MDMNLELAVAVVIIMFSVCLYMFLIGEIAYNFSHKEAKKKKREEERAKDQSAKSREEEEPGEDLLDAYSRKRQQLDAMAFSTYQQMERLAMEEEDVVSDEVF